MKHEVVAASDWPKLAAEGLTTVVDPMIYRCGEMFLGGARSSGNAETTWSLLKANIHGIGMFFDRLILDSKLPVFNYADTFDTSLNFDKRVLTRINDYEEILFDVDVSYEAYHQVKAAALEEVQKLYEGEGGRIQAAFARDRRIGTVPWAPKPELKATVADALALKPPGSIDFTPTLKALWGWSLASLPGKRYRKLLTRAVLEDHQYVELEKRVEAVWKAG